MKFSLSFFLSLLFVSSLFAGPFHPSGFKYKKEVKYPDKLTDSKVGKFLLDEEIFRGSFYGDIRLVQGGSSIPYIRKTVVDSDYTKEEKIKAKLLYKKDEEYQTIFVLELPKLPPGMVYTKLEAESDSSYEAQVSVSSGSSPNNWSHSSSTSLFRYGDENNSQIPLSSTRNRFIRIEGPTNLSYNFPYVYRRKMETNSVWTYNAEVPAPETEENSFVYLFPNETQTPFSILNLKLKESKWEREIQIRSFQDHTWKVVFEGLVSHSPEEGEFTTIPLDSLITGKYKINISHGDNPPIPLEQTVQVQTQEEILFFLPEDKNTPLELYFGNRYARFPDYDPNFMPTEEDLKQENISLHLKEQTDNPEFTWSFAEPPISGYIASALFYLGLICIIGISLFFYKSIKKESTV